ncbi:MAG TPA: hypothetical protein VMS60_09560 [Solirubrobacterales bacterium]|nr:hypothetical protein [Solirubrobacterales bacterium]
MSKVLSALLLSGLVLVAIGCGGGEETDSGADASKPNSLLLIASELPDGTTTGDSPPELCGPLPILEKNGGQTAVSKTFVVGKTKVVEAVGVFETPAKAESAFGELNDSERLECISGAIELFGGASSVETDQMQPRDVGDDDTVVRYVAFDDDSAGDSDGESKPDGYSDVVTVRVGRCIASLLIGIESGDPPDAVSEQTAHTVADRLSDACE